MVINGLPSVQARADESAKLLEWAFANFRGYQIGEAGAVMHQAPVWLGQQERVPLVLEEPVFLTLSTREAGDLNVYVELKQPIAAPISAGQTLGELVIEAPESEQRVPLKAQTDVPQLEFMGRVEAALTQIVFGSQ